MEEHGFNWTTDDDRDLVHERIIDGDSFAEVHKVLPIENLAKYILADQEEHSGGYMIIA